MRTTPTRRRTTEYRRRSAGDNSQMIERRRHAPAVVMTHDDIAQSPTVSFKHEAMVHRTLRPRHPLHEGLVHVHSVE